MTIAREKAGACSNETRMDDGAVFTPPLAPRCSQLEARLPKVSSVEMGDGWPSGCTAQEGSIPLTSYMMH